MTISRNDVIYQTSKRNVAMRILCESRRGCEQENKVVGVEGLFATLTLRVVTSFRYLDALGSNPLGCSHS